MKLLSFQARFAEPVRLGIKRQTIRRVGKRQYFPGDKLRLYTGLRTARAVHLLDAEVTKVQRLILDIAGSGTVSAFWWWHDETLNVPDHRPHAIDDAFARADGFSCREDMLDFFTAHARPTDRRDAAGIQLDCNMIHWCPL